MYFMRSLLSTQYLLLVALCYTYLELNTHCLQLPTYYLLRLHSEDLITAEHSF